MADPNRTPTLAQVIRNAIDARLLDVHTAIPAVVDSYDADKQTLEATPSIMLPVRGEDGEVSYHPLPQVKNCPVVFPGAGGFRLTFPVAKGDSVLLLFAESSLDAWLANGGQVDPGDNRRHHLSDAIAIPSLRPTSKAWQGASTSAMTLGKDGGPQVVVRDSVVELGGTDSDAPTEPVLLGNTYLQNEGQFLSQLESACTTLTAVAAQLQSAGPLMSTPIYGAVAAGPLITSAGASLLSAAQSLNAACQAFANTQAEAKSQKVKTK